MLGKLSLGVCKRTDVWQAINEIGWTNYHTKLFFLNGFG
jgi:hypothetical protein